MDYDQLSLADMDQSYATGNSTKITAGTTTEKNLEDLPFTVFVITAEEIREQGYYTLVDALKHLPGIRVSQPGSGLDGETFLMRGLYGNTYAKILINGTPIRPSVVGAMPIGSQLPIRQAERIEVIYGPAATLYGPDAAAGVINIILKDSEYPTFAQADVEVGDDRLTRISALFGGKILIRNKVMKVKMFGGYTSFSDREIKYDIENLYNPQVYEDLINLDEQDILQFEDRPNFVGDSVSTVLTKLPHQSSYVGFSLALGDFDFTVQRQFRSDHSSLGLNPYAVSYADPQSLIGEEILTTTLGFHHTYSKWAISVNLNSVNYTINSLSSYNYVLPLFGTITNGYALGFIGDASIEPSAKIPAKIDSLFLAGPRYVSSDFYDLSLNVRANINLNKNVNLAFGLLGESGLGDAIERYQIVPSNSTSGNNLFPSILENPIPTFSSISAFIEGDIKFNKFSIIAGAQGFIREDQLVQNDPVFNPRLGLLYRPNSEFSVRASYSQAFRYPTAYFANSSYTISKKDDFVEIEIGSPDLEPEQTINYEAGLRYRPTKKINLDFSLFSTKTTNFINFDIIENGTDNSLFWGYANDPNSFSQLYGSQLSLNLIDIVPALKLSSQINLSYTKGKESLLQLVLEDFLDRGIQEIPVVRAQPNLIGHVRLIFEPYKEFKIILNNSFLSGSWTRNKRRITSAISNNSTESLINSGYYTLGVRSQLKISRQLNAYIDLSNLTNIQYAGIDASPHVDGLLYNPQPLFRLRFGVNFSFN